MFMTGWMSQIRYLSLFYLVGDAGNPVTRTTCKDSGFNRYFAKKMKVCRGYAFLLLEDLYSVIFSLVKLAKTLMRMTVYGC